MPRLITLSARCKDMFTVSEGANRQSGELYRGYVPDPFTLTGDEFVLVIDLDTGEVHDWNASFVKEELEKLINPKKDEE